MTNGMPICRIRSAAKTVAPFRTMTSVSGAPRWSSSIWRASSATRFLMRRAEISGRSLSVNQEGRSIAPVGVAAGAFELHPEMLAECANRIALLGVGIGVALADDDRPEAAVVPAAGRQHRRRQRAALAV